MGQSPAHVHPIPVPGSATSGRTAAPTQPPRPCSAAARSRPLPTIPAPQLHYVGASTTVADPVHCDGATDPVAASPAPMPGPAPPAGGRPSGQPPYPRHADPSGRAQALRLVLASCAHPPRSLAIPLPLWRPPAGRPAGAPPATPPPAAAPPRRPAAGSGRPGRRGRLSAAPYRLNLAGCSPPFWRPTQPTPRSLGQTSEDATPRYALRQPAGRPVTTEAHGSHLFRRHAGMHLRVRRRRTRRRSFAVP